MFFYIYTHTGEIMEHIKAHGWSSGNVFFGAGASLLQRVSESSFVNVFPHLPFPLSFLPFFIPSSSLSVPLLLFPCPSFPSSSFPRSLLSLYFLRQRYQFLSSLHMSLDSFVLCPSTLLFHLSVFLLHCGTVRVFLVQHICIPALLTDSFCVRIS